MLSLKKIKKSYRTGEFIQHALKGVDLSFRKNEFVSILGASGSGKTTLLNIIGGLDRYESGDLIIDNKSTKNFKAKDWDSYRNNCVGFIFQSYNLISHISVLANVEMGMTLSNVSKSKRKKKALEVLKRVGLIEHVHKKPNQLSGGQMQRVAIARALANDPNIILADEPTGALDSETSVQIMELIKEIAKDKLVIMVTHNPELADEYSSRIVSLKDGEVISDSNPYNNNDKKDKLIIKKSKMSYLTALSLSFNNILTKKGRTILTALASSIGIIGIALILSLSNGFDLQIKKFEENSLSSMPIMIQSQTTTMEDMHNAVTGSMKNGSYTDKKELYPALKVEEVLHNNLLSQEYIDLIEGINPEYISAINYTKVAGLNMIYINSNDEYMYTTNNNISMQAYSMEEGRSTIRNSFDLLEGNYPANMNEIIILTDKFNTIPQDVLTLLGLDNQVEKIDFNDIMEKTFKVILNDDFFIQYGQNFIPNMDYESLYNDSNAITLKVSGIARLSDGKISFGKSGIGYSEELVDYIIEKNMDSKIVKVQKNSMYNVMNGIKFTNDEEGKKAKEQIVAYLGGSNTPFMIGVYPKNFESKEKILEILDSYNEGKEKKNQVLYMDMAEMITTLSSGIMDAITIVLVAFSTISLVVSSVMIGIITYTSVLERTKEIGILRSLGARKKDITRVFNSETFIIGLTSGLLGIGITLLLTIPANMIIYSLTDLSNVAVLNPVDAILLIIVSLTLTVIGGLIPAFMASKKDPVTALRTE